jgi:hypothetical protein
MALTSSRLRATIMPLTPLIAAPVNMYLFCTNPPAVELHNGTPILIWRTFRNKKIAVLMRRRQSRGGQKEFTLHTVYTMGRLSNPEEYIFRLPLLSPNSLHYPMIPPHSSVPLSFSPASPGTRLIHFLKILPGDAERSFEGVVCILAA